MPRKSAGLLMYRRIHDHVEVFLVHPGGPFWAHKDEGAWSIPKGEFPDNEDPLEAAKREFKEETGFAIKGEFQPLDPVKQPNGKMVFGWVVEGDIEPRAIKSNTFSLEWPRGSGTFEQLSEIDRGDWFTIEIAKRKILKGQVAFLDQLEKAMASGRIFTLDTSITPPGEKRQGRTA